MVSLVYVASLATQETQAFWTTDNANKFLQMESIVASQHRDYAIAWPGVAIDPGYRFNPLPAPFSIVVDGRLFSQYSPVFATVSSVPYGLWGYPGLFVLPILGAMVALAGVATIAREGAPGRAGAPALAVVIAGLSTPLWFYAVAFWEHTLALAASVWATRTFIVYARNPSWGRLVVAVGLSCVAVAFREELVLLSVVSIAMAIGASPRRRVRTAAIAASTAASSLAPLLAFHAWALGHPLGFHAASNASSLAQLIESRPTAFYNLLLRAGNHIGESLVITSVFVGLLAWRPRVSARVFRVVVPALAGFASLTGGLVLWHLARSPDPIATLSVVNSVYPCAPIVLLALVRRRSDDVRRDLAGRESDPLAARWLWTLSVGLALGYALLAPEISTSGMHWGNRFLLPLYPMLSVLAAWNVVDWLSAAGRSARAKAAMLPMAAVCAIGVAAQVWSIDVARAKRAFSARLNRIVAERPEQILVTDQWWVPQELHVSFGRKMMFVARTPSDFADLEQILAERGRPESLLVTSATGRGVPAGAELVQDRDLGHFSIILASRRSGAWQSEIREAK